jgi:hypothetical protein
MNQHTKPLAEPATDPQRRYLCRHIHTLGHRCRAAALRGADLCYYHTRTRIQAPASGRSGTFAAPCVEDRASIQLALSDLLARIAGGDIDLHRADRLLKVLREASLNLSRRTPATSADPATPQPQVEAVTHHPHLGDLAPITQIPTETEAAAQAAAAHAPTTQPFDRANLFTGIFAIEKQPTTQPTHTPALAVILSEAKDPDTAHTTSTSRTFLPPRPAPPTPNILPTIQATAAALTPTPSQPSQGHLRATRTAARKSPVSRSCFPIFGPSSKMSDFKRLLCCTEQTSSRPIPYGER